MRAFVRRWASTVSTLPDAKKPKLKLLRYDEERLSVAIIGRPNVGKSTLFNRLAKKGLALVDPTPGVTRDVQECVVEVGDIKFRVMDTAGLQVETPSGSLLHRMREQTEWALERADLALFLVDAREGIHAEDKNIAEMVRKRGIPAILAANKCDVGDEVDETGKSRDMQALGLGNPVPISAEQGMGLADLYAAVQPLVIHRELECVDLRAPLSSETQTSALPELSKKLESGDVVPTPARSKKSVLTSNPSQERVAFSRESGGASEGGKGTPSGKAGPAEEEEEEAEEEGPIQLAIVGKPNVGKSTLVNALFGEQLLLTGPEPGLTRDAISVDALFHGRHLRLVDTAGLRKRAFLKDNLDKQSHMDTLRAIRFANVVCVVVDASQEPLSKEDLTIARRVVEEGRSLVVAVNKWDLVMSEEEVIARLQEKLDSSLPQVKGVPCVLISALNNKNLGLLLKACMQSYDRWNVRIPTGKLNRFVQKMNATYPGRRAPAHYITQVKARPPTFAIFGPGAIPDSYLRMVANSIRTEFSLPGVPFRFLERKTGK